jgi:hypothetical protein
MHLRICWTPSTSVWVIESVLGFFNSFGTDVHSCFPNAPRCCI